MNRFEQYCFSNDIARIKRAKTRPFDIFICYKRLSGEDFAEHLKAGLEELGMHSFLDLKDIPKKFRGMEEWTNAIDKAICESKVFVLVITAGFDLSPEIKRELALARKNSDREFVYFRHESLKADLKVALENGELNLEKQEQISFSTKNDLIRKAYCVLNEDQKV